MVSPEILRRYPTFAYLDSDQLREVAMISEVVERDVHDTIFEAGEPAEYLYLLLDGSVDLHYVVAPGNKNHGQRKDFMVGTINPGEILGISALIEPYKLTSAAMTTLPCKLVRVSAVELRELCAKDVSLSCSLQRAVARATMERLHATRILLAAATAPV
jgi:CRP/FNR family cyclic AMP-dependent transcriptional regulator